VKKPTDNSSSEGLTELESFRAQELLLLRATEGLSEEQLTELSELGADDDDSYDLAAAALDLATLPRQEMPFDVAQRILLAAGARPPRSGSEVQETLQQPASLTPRPSSASSTSSSTSSASSPSSSPSSPPSSSPSSPPGSGADAPIIPLAPRRSRAPMIVACTAAVAGLAAAAGAILWAAQKEPTVIVQRIEVPAPPLPPPRAPLPSEARAQLLASATDVQTLPWTATADDAARGVSGDVVWSASKQEGYLRFVGLVPNDPRLLQYQLWIFDKLRDQRYPVDGGVFDIGPSGEIVIKIAPKLRVNEPVLFAITIEPPGGVVVSKRERIVVTASPAKAG
jgi:hypothetical protein